MGRRRKFSRHGENGGRDQADKQEASSFQPKLLRPQPISFFGTSLVNGSEAVLEEISLKDKFAYIIRGDINE
jgi:hypothetical protein